MNCSGGEKKKNKTTLKPVFIPNIRKCKLPGTDVGKGPRMCISWGRGRGLREGGAGES